MKAWTNHASIDANVILRYLTGDDVRLSEKAIRIMQAVEKGTLAVTCDPVILGEVVWVLQSFYGFSRKEIAEALEPIVKSDMVQIIEKDRYIRALRIYAGSSAHFGDACASAPALEDCDGKLLSFDRKLDSIEGIVRLEEPHV